MFIYTVENIIQGLACILALLFIAACAIRILWLKVTRRGRKN